MLDDRLLIKTIERKFTKGGLVLPASAQNDKKSVFNMKEGIVVKAGPGRYTTSGVKSDMTVGVGDYVYYPGHLAGPLEIEGEQYVVINESTLIAYTKKENISPDQIELQE